MKLAHLLLASMFAVSLPACEKKSQYTAEADKAPSREPSPDGSAKK